MNANREIPLYQVGIDEAGRGPIAGPVVVGAFVFLDLSAARLFRGVKESKQLIEAQREAWFAKIEQAKADGLVNYCVTFQSEKVIDGPGLSHAIREALKCSLDALQIQPDQAEVLLDGGLRAPQEYIHQKTIIKGDEKKKVIALASICAKVLRDRFMNEFAKKHPEYGFEAHKGYGTAQHFQAIELYGTLPIHRKSFLEHA